MMVEVVKQDSRKPVALQKNWSIVVTKMSHVPRSSIFAQRVEY